MVVLDNVSKRYVSKTKQKVDALRGVRFELASTGMVFILGKSGSGKSTLLNLLGGLDSPTAGEIIVDGVRMKNFKQKDYDSYRNSYVGFIFQEYNLLGDLNVKQNIELALQLSKEKDVDQTVSDAMRQVELNDEYLKRNVNELSGGEKQRVAIARCIVKESKMILADEPTGNLDSATGESIWNILKTLSRSKLVVVVSHDRESAEKYADRILEISDGEIVSDSGEQPKDERPASPFVATKKRLPFAVCLKLGLNNMKQHKVRSVFTVLLSVFSLAALLITEMCLCISPQRSVVQFIKQHDIPYFSVCQLGNRSESGYVNPDLMKSEALDYIGQNCNSLVDGIVENKQDVLDFGLNFAGDASELDSNSCYITEYQLNLNKKCLFVEVNGEMVSYDEEEFSVEQLVGKRIDCSDLFTPQNDNYPTLAGVIRTEQYGTDAYILPQVFAREDFESRHKDEWKSYVVNKYDSYTRFIYGKGNTYIYTDIGLVSSQSYENGKIITADCTVGKAAKTNGEILLDDDEIVLSYELYAQLFTNRKTKYGYIDEKYQNVRDIPQQLGQSFELKLFDDKTGKTIANLGEYRLAGVYFQNYPTNTSMTGNISHFYAIFNEKTMRNLWKDIHFQTVCIRADSIRNLQTFAHKLEKRYNAVINSAGNDRGEEYGYEDVTVVTFLFAKEIKSILIIVGVLGGVLLFFMLLMVVNLITFSVTDRIREIGMLMGLGASKRDIYNIFILEALTVSAFNFVIVLCVIYALAAVLNVAFSKIFIRVVPFFCVEYITIAVAFVISFGFILLAAWLPLRKIAKLNPIDAIKQL